MSSLARLLEQRSTGHVKLHMGIDGPCQLREQGAAKVRVPRGSREAILINTSGGLAGGDEVTLDIACQPGAELSVTSQAAERVYRTLGPAATISTRLAVGPQARFAWLPQETILFDGASLHRRYDVHLSEDAAFTALEPIVFGRTEMGEVVRSVTLRDTWRIWRDGLLVHADDLVFDGPLPVSKACLAGTGAMATLIHVSAEGHRRMDALRGAIGASGGVSHWNGRLVARVAAKDGHHLRKILIPMLTAILGGRELPKVWTF
jgi:urease accessory protein